MAHHLTIKQTLIGSALFSAAEAQSAVAEAIKRKNGQRNGSLCLGSKSIDSSSLL